VSSGGVPSWLVFAPAILLTCANLWIRIHNRRGKKYISSILVVPTIVAVIPMLVVANTAGHLKAAGHPTSIALKPLRILTAAIIVAEVSLFLFTAFIRRRL
jgi:hypothetical protein